MNHTHHRASGFTAIELMVVIVLLLILGTLVALTYSGVQAKNRNAERQNSIDIIQGQLEAYYAQTDTYPSLAQVNDPAWRKIHLKNLAASALEDPQWNTTISSCTKDGKAALSAEPTTSCYSYQVTGADGSVCDNNTAQACAHYTLTALLEGGERYVKGSLN